MPVSIIETTKSQIRQNNPLYNMKTVKLIRLYYPFYLSEVQIREAQRFLIIDQSGYSIYYRRYKITKLFQKKYFSLLLIKFNQYQEGARSNLLDKR